MHNSGAFIITLLAVAALFDGETDSGKTRKRKQIRQNDMDDKTINLQEYKENKRQASIETQKQWEEDYKAKVMELANSSPTPTTTYTTNDLDNPEVREKVMNGVVITEDRCVCCGKPVPEGRMVCEECERKTFSSSEPTHPLPPKTWERSPEERWGKSKKGWIERLFGR